MTEYLRRDDGTLMPVGSQVSPDPKRVAKIHAARDAKLLAQIERVGGELHIAGVVECQTAQRLINQDRIVLTSGTISDEGGHGVVKLAQEGEGL